MRRVPIAGAFVLSLIVGIACFGAAPRASSLTLPTVPTTLASITLTLPLDTTLPTLPDTTVPVTVTTIPITIPTVTTTTVRVIVTTVPLTVPTVTTIPGVTVPTLPGVPVTIQVPATVPGGVTTAGLYECAHFLTQQAAQVVLLADPREVALLDPDHNGVACELLPSGSATTAQSSQSSGGGSGTQSDNGSGTGTTAGGADRGNGSTGEPSRGDGTAAGPDPNAPRGALGSGARGADAAASALGDQSVDHTGQTIIAFIMLLLAGIGTFLGHRAGWFAVPRGVLGTTH